MGATKESAFTEEQLRLAGIFKALGHPARIAILQKLVEAGCCIGREFTDELDLAQPTISRHLRELRDAGVVCSTTDGNKVKYCIAPAFVNQLMSYLACC